jgi:hypothetical protein
MKKTTSIVTLLLCVFLLSKVNAQDLDLKWSDKIDYDNKKDGFFEDFIDANSKYVYCKYTNLTMKPKRVDAKVKLVAFDKTTMKKVADVSLKGFKENKDQKEKLQPLKYYKTIVFENLVYVFWINDKKGKEELYVQSFNSNLKAQGKLKKIYECTTNDSRWSRASRSTIVLSNKKCGEKIIIGAELPAAAGQDIKFEYKVLNSDFTFSTANQITLPVKLISKAYGATSGYEFGDDGSLYISTSVSMDKDERKNARKGEITSYGLLSQVELATGNIIPYTVKFDNKNVLEYSYLIEKNGVKVYGFYSDLDKDPKGYAIHGIFYTRLDNAFKSAEQNFSPFDKATLDKLFANDTEDKSQAPKGTSKKKKEKQKQAEEALDNRFEIENVQSAENNSIVLFCAKRRNYSVTHCNTSSNGSTSCYTTYYSERSNVTTFKLSSTGALVWASNLDRKITYAGGNGVWYTKDLNVVKQDDKYYVIYGSAYQANAAKKNHKSKKSKKQRQDRFEYAVFENANGNYKKNEFVVNAINAKEQKTVMPTEISVIDNRFYVNSEKLKYKALTTTAFCLGTIVCWPAGLGWYMLGDGAGKLKKGDGNLGVISPLK